MKRARRSDDLPALRRFGQNFLVDAGAIARICDALSPLPGEALLEIGPGRGALTGALLATGLPVVAVEIDRGLAERLRERFAGRPLVVLEQDILDLDFRTVASRAGLSESAPLVVAGNLPYNLSKPIAMRIVGERAQVARAVLMFQREVADRLLAVPGTKEYGPLGVLAGLAFRIERVQDLPPGAFRPRPKVTSTVTRWTRRDPSPLDDALEPALRRVLRAAFARRRGTLRVNLRAALDETSAASVLSAAGVDDGLRAERLPPEAFLRMAAAWPTVDLYSAARASRGE